jgi:tetratricopeptide (TPR) repeat protein/predicted Ser/Thr protein kinase
VSAPPHPERIGPYRIVEVLGEGGMGVVYLAEQTEPVSRRVALKILRPGVDSPEVLARFDGERQALAVMDHPYIAKVFDAGTTEDGRSYFVMEKVDGQPLTDFCDQRRYPIRRRVKLFAEVCRAVQHAHQKGVIHRDLKPSNLLVSEMEGRPIPHIIDFGIAKATGTGEFDGTHLTREDRVLGTPAYMSPEQIMGSADVDTRSDVYSLGVLLYELLIGVLPYDRDAYRGWAAVASHIAVEPLSPAARLHDLEDTQETIAAQRSTTPKLLRKELRGDLDWIVSRAMEKDRDRRYETANGLALDLERFLAFQPVRARGGSVAYSLGKFVRRHRVGVAFGATVALGIVAFAVVMAIQADRVARARDLAESRRDQAEGLIDFMLTDLREKLEPVGQLDILDDVGAQAIDYFASIPESEFSDGELASRARALHQIGQVRLQQGRLAEAEPAFEESLRLAEALSSRNPEDTERLFDLGQSRFWVGTLAYRRGDLEGALDAFDEYRNVSLALVSRDSTNLTWQLERGYSHTNIGVTLLERGDPRAALVEFEASLAAKEWVARAEPESARRRYDVAQGHYNLGIARAEGGDPRGARESYLADVEIKEALVAEDPGNTRWRARLLVSQGRLAGIERALGREDAALELRRRQWDEASSLIQRDPTNTTWRLDGAVARGTLGRDLVAHGDIAAGLAHCREAVRALEELVTSDPSRAQWPVRLAGARRRYAEALLMADRGEDARRVAAQALADLRAHMAEGYDDRVAWLELGMGLGVLGDVADATGDRDAARASWQEALNVMDARPTASTDWRILSVRARALVRLGRTVEAAPLVERLEVMGVVPQD